MISKKSKSKKSFIVDAHYTKPNLSFKIKISEIFISIPTLPVCLCKDHRKLSRFLNNGIAESTAHSRYFHLKIVLCHFHSVESLSIKVKILFPRPDFQFKH